MRIENPNQMWVLEDGVYHAKAFGEKEMSESFNSLPNSPYLKDGSRVQYIGFLEGKGGKSTFSELMLFVVLEGECKTEKHNISSKQACFGREINCEVGAIVLVFAIMTFYRSPYTLFGCREECWKNNLVTKYRIYGQNGAKMYFFLFQNSLGTYIMVLLAQLT